jgi:hypothetical protein
MTVCIFWLLIVNVTADNPVEITLSDDETKNNATLVNPLDIVADP